MPKSLETLVTHLMASNMEVSPDYMRDLAVSMDVIAIYVDICADSRHVFHKLANARRENRTNKRVHLRSYQTAGNVLTNIPEIYQYGIVITHTKCGASAFSQGYNQALLQGGDALAEFLEKVHVHHDEPLTEIARLVDGDVVQNSMTYNIDNGQLTIHGIVTRDSGDLIPLNYKPAGQVRGSGDLGYVNETHSFAGFKEIHPEDQHYGLLETILEMIKGNEVFMPAYADFLARKENAYLAGTQKPKIIEINFTDLLLQEYTRPDDIFDHVGEVFTIRDDIEKSSLPVRLSDNYAWKHFTRHHMNLDYSATTIILARTEEELAARTEEIVRIDQSLVEYASTERGKIIGIVVNNNRDSGNYGRFESIYKIELSEGLAEPVVYTRLR